MDHHCGVLGVCIGKKNMKCFLSCLIWVLIGGLSALILVSFDIYIALIYDYKVFYSYIVRFYKEDILVQLIYYLVHFQECLLVFLC